EDIELPDADEREETRAGLTYPEYAPESELSSTYLGQIEDVNRDVRLFNSILVGDSDPFRPAILRLASVHWRDEETLAGITRSALVQSVQDQLDAVRIIPGEPVTLASRTGITGVLVANDLEDESVFVLLSVYSENSERLSVGEYTDSFEIEPGAKTTVYVPLSARINGRTVLHVSLHNAEGEPINSDESQIPVNATGLGTQALLISGIGVLILVAALAPRALRMWARKQTARARAAAAQDGENVEDAVASQKPVTEEPGAQDDRPEPEPMATEPGDTPAPGPEDTESADTGAKTSGPHTDGDDTHRETGGTNTSPAQYSATASPLRNSSSPDERNPDPLWSPIPRTAEVNTTAVHPSPNHTRSTDRPPERTRSTPPVSPTPPTRRADSPNRGRSPRTQAAAPTTAPHKSPNPTRAPTPTPAPAPPG